MNDKEEGKLNNKFLIREFDKADIKRDLLNVTIQLLSDTKYTKEMAVEEILKVVKKVENIR